MLALAIAAAAFLARLIPVLRSSGLYAVKQYDSAVYFGAAIGLVHGRMPYRDFLLLHPPGIVLALAPFAVLGYGVGDAQAMALARLGCMLLGSLNAVVIYRILRPATIFGAVFGGLFYAVFYPAVAVEQTTRLEPVAGTCLVVALLLLCRERRRDVAGWVVLAGALLGYATVVKIWGVVPFLVLAVWLLRAAGLRQLLWLTLGAVGAGTVVCLPFFLASPVQMWRYVIVNQVDRARSATPVTARLADMTGLGLLKQPLAAWLPLLVGVAVLCFVLAAVLATHLPEARLAVALLGILSLMLLAVPSWFPHYPGLIAGPAAITVGAATGPLLRRTARWRPRAPVLVTAALVVGLTVYAVPLRGARFGHSFPAARLQAAVRTLPGCITSDDPSTLIELDVLSRNLDRGCHLSLDLGGYSYVRRSEGSNLRRHNDPEWQRFALSYLSSGSATLVVRYSTRFGFTRATEATINRWPVIARAGRYQLRRPSWVAPPP
ncbi:hypothetical protein GCM10009841_21620 [Microlunatus panaciterrae]